MNRDGLVAGLPRFLYAFRMFWVAALAGLVPTGRDCFVEREDDGCGSLTGSTWATLEAEEWIGRKEVLNGPAHKKHRVDMK